MEMLLLFVTIVSIAGAIAALTSAARLRRHERERSDARVAALAAAAETHGAPDGGWKQVAGEWQWVAVRVAPVAEPIARPETSDSKQPRPGQPPGQSSPCRSIVM